MQAQARVGQHLGLTALEDLGQDLAEAPAHALGARALLAGQHVVLLRHVRLGHHVEGVGHAAVGQRGSRHAPGADAGAHEVHGVAAACQPVAEDVAVQAVEDQPLGAAGRRRDEPDVLRAQAAFGQARPGGRAGEDVEGGRAHRATR